MGHERVGFLPKTRRWSDLIKQMETLDSSGISASKVASQTLWNVKERYESLFKDDTVKNVFIFLITFARACRFPDTKNQLKISGIELSNQPTLLTIVKALRENIPPREAISEYGQLAIAAAADAIGQWYKEHDTGKLSLFQPSVNSFDNWRNLGNGAGFCELTRLFFGKLTERYLNYFLDRSASSTFSNIQQREQFQQAIRTHVDEVSKHAFETAKITQSFAAGWFNKNTSEGLPSEKDTEGFLAIAFGKLRDELRREEETK